MGIVNCVMRNRYQDSVTLMQVAVKLRDLPGVADAALMMGTEPNKEILQEAGLLTEEGSNSRPDDIIVAIEGSDETIASALARIDEIMGSAAGTGGAGSGGAESNPRSLGEALTLMPESNLVLISTPGIYATAEAQKAISSGRHVMIFSDNVSLDDEIRLKREAQERGLLLMGPDCGTAIIAGVPLGFANAVRRGSIGVVGASGTGMQEITSLVDRYGGGISHAIGTGSRDLSAQVGAITTLAGLRALQRDPETQVIVIVSKPPDEAVAAKVLDAAGQSVKPTVVAFLGMQQLGSGTHGANIVLVETLEDAARRAVELAGGQIEPSTLVDVPEVRLAPSQRYVRGLFSGGTFCYEAMLLARRLLGPVYSNAPLSPDLKVTARNSHTPIRGKHVFLDLGADEFTVGRPHPMIDTSVRAERILLEATDPEVAVLLMDVVLGYGAHPDPAGALAPVIEKARQHATREGRNLAVVASICGTERDPQNFKAQKASLEAAGALVAPSNAAAAHLAAQIATSAGMGEKNGT